MPKRDISRGCISEQRDNGMGFLRFVIPLTAALLTFGPVALLIRVIDRKKKLTKKKRILLTLVIGLILYSVGGFAYFGIYCHGDATAYQALDSGNGVSVSQVRNGYLFDGPGTERALVFYPGAKVEAEAYAPLIRRIAEGGVDCFLLDMPLHMAFMGQERAGEFIGAYDYKEWYICGHSLGGAVAAFYAADHPEQLDGLILLAAYPARPLDTKMPLLLIYGDQDGVIQRDVYEKNKSNWTEYSTEVILTGANHAQFGNYGVQKGDHTATISAEEQQRRTAEEILTFISEKFP